MKLSGNMQLRRLWTLGLAMSLSLLSGCASQRIQMPTGSPSPPTNYEYDAFSKYPSKYCRNPSGNSNAPAEQYLVVPRAESSDNRYVLLLAFDTPDNSNNAGQALFHADPRDTDPAKKPTAACFPDPIMKDISGQAVGTPNPFVLLVGGGKGGCPDDCTSQLPDGTYAFRRNSGSPNPGPDPLGKNGMYWGIMFGNSDSRPGCENDVKPTDGSQPIWCHDSAVRVWQIRVRNVQHAQKILGTLESMGLTLKGKYPGYLGHLVIGYRYSGHDTDY
jgi:hypothetical protein